MIKRKIYLIFGFIFFGLGLFGYYMPVLPGTIFMILAAYCFMHSSKTLYNKIVNHPIYGNPIKDYIENHFISLRAKYIILASMWGATMFTVYITPSMRFPTSLTFFNLSVTINIKIIGIVLAAIGTFAVLRAKHK